MAEDTVQQQRGKPFRPGQSGNPAGRPKGSRNATTKLVEGLMEGQAEGITQVVVSAALGGDLTAARLILDRLAPARKDRAVALDLPPITTSADSAMAMAAVVSAMADGQITPNEAGTVAAVLEGHRRALELTEIERRLEALEQRSDLK